MVGIIGILILFCITAYIFSKIGGNEYFINSKGQRILNPKKKATPFFKGQCNKEEHCPPFYYGGGSMGSGEPDEPCQCGNLTVAQIRAKNISTMFRHKGDL